MKILGNPRYGAVILINGARQCSVINVRTKLGNKKTFPRIEEKEKGAAGVPIPVLEKKMDRTELLFQNSSTFGEKFQKQVFFDTKCQKI